MEAIHWPASSGLERGRAMQEVDRLRKLAAWYREFAERAGEPWIWQARLETAGELENKAALLERDRIQIEGPGGPASP